MREASFKVPEISPGATIALIAPAGAFNPELLEASKEKIGKMGYNIVYSNRIWRRKGDVCGNEWERATDIIDFMKSPSVDAIWCIRGGYGSGQILSRLPRLPWHKKPLIGYSDISFLHFFIHSSSEALGFHGPNFIELAAMDPVDIEKIIETLKKPLSFVWKFEKSQVIRPGTASGKLIGGNLTCLTHLLGTPYLSPKVFRRAVLFVEDVNEKPYRIDRMFIHLRDAGVIEEIGALLLGQFTGCGGNYTDIRNRIVSICSPFNFPIIEGFPAGHEIPQTCIPVGLRAIIDTSTGIMCLGTDSV